MNRTDPLARQIHSTNPQRIVEKILRLKIYASPYWKEHCFGLTSETLVDRAIALTSVGGTYGGTRKPTKFMCLLLKMLQIQPDLEIVQEFIQTDFKYVRCLGALYLRCTGRPREIFEFLEPLYADYSKIRIRSFEGWSLSSVDAFIETLLTSDYSCDISLPFLPKRAHLGLPRRVNLAWDGEVDRKRPAEEPTGRGQIPFKKKKDIDDDNRLRAELGLKPLRL